MSNAIEIRDLSYRAGRSFELRDVSVTVPEGSIYGFLGPNGAGKTTTIRLLLGMVRRDGGDVRLQEFGSARFEAFWTSDADVPTAFAGAFGIGAGDWVREWGHSRYGDRALGPRVDAVTLLLSALLISCLVAAAVVTERRRTQ